MKKFLLLFISILSLSFLFNTNNTHAQEPIYNLYPNDVMLATFNFLYEPFSYGSVYDFLVDYTVNNICIEDINQNEYFLVSNIDINFSKGINRSTNSYEIISVYCTSDTYTRTWIQVNITVLKSYVHDNYNYPENIELLFSRDTALYILRYSTSGSLNYDIGYHNGFKDSFNIGYNNGYNIGYIKGDTDGYSDAGDLTYDLGYNDGYEVGFKDGYLQGVAAVDKEALYQEGYTNGYNDRRFKFTSDIHIWIIPAIILVFSLSIYISYRKGRNYNE